MSWCKQRGDSSCQLKPAAFKLNPVAYSQVYSVQWSFATINQPAEPQTDPQALQHLALPLLITGKDPIQTLMSVYSLHYMSNLNHGSTYFRLRKQFLWFMSKGLQSVSAVLQCAFSWVSLIHCASHRVCIHFQVFVPFVKPYY